MEPIETQENLAQPNETQEKTQLILVKPTETS